MTFPRMTTASLVVFGLLLSNFGCATAQNAVTTRTSVAAQAPPVDHNDPLLDDAQHRAFQYFWDTANTRNGLIPDRYPTDSFASIAAVGFALTAYPVGVERGWITREQARERTVTTLRFFESAPQGPDATGMTGYKGFFYHFLDMHTGARFETVELSTIDTALLIAGAILCREYFDGTDNAETEIRQLADTLESRVDWQWAASARPPGVAMGWTPEEGHHFLNWHGYNEAAILYVLAIGSPSHPIDPAAWREFTHDYYWHNFHGYKHLNFGPLFGHQYSHIWIDFRGIRDKYMRAKKFDYFINSRRATLSQRAYAADNPKQFDDYSKSIWGISANDGPLDGTLTIRGRQRTFRSYAGRGVAANFSLDDGTLAPAAVAASVPFAPEVVLPALHAYKDTYGEDLYGRYGFFNAINPTLNIDTPVQHGKVVVGVGWFDTDWLGIDNGPVVSMAENFRTGMIWNLMRNNTTIIRGLRRADFRGGWLKTAPQ